MRGILITGLLSGLAEFGGGLLAVQSYGWTPLATFMVVVGIISVGASAYWLAK